MEKFRGNISGAGSELVSQVVGALQEIDFPATAFVPAGAGKEWSGYFDLPAGLHLVGGSFRLELDDGRSGDIRVSHVSTGRHQVSVAYFQGSGPLK